MKGEKYDRDRFVRMLENPGSTRERLSPDTVLMNIEPFAEACMSLFAKPGDIRQKIKLMRGLCGPWFVPSEEEEKLGSIGAQILGKTIAYRKQVLEGIKNMDVSGFDYYRGGGWDHEGENIVYLIFHSKLNEDPEVIRELWAKIKQSPNGFLGPDEFGPFMGRALRDAETYRRIVSFGPIRAGLINGQSIGQAAYPLITNFGIYREFNRKRYEGIAPSKDGHKDPLRDIESDAGSIFILETLDRVICRR